MTTPQETTEIGNREHATSGKTPLPTPYTYIRINGDPELESRYKDLPTTKKVEALYGTGEAKPADIILKDVQRAVEGSSLHSEYWREKGLPIEQVLLTLTREGVAREINIYNYNESNLLTEKQLQIMQETLKKIAVRFPWLANRIKTIALDNEGKPSLMDDEIRFPYSGTTMTGGIHLAPRALDLSIAHRVQQENKNYFENHPTEEVSNLEGTIIHEVTHLGDAPIWLQWKKNDFHIRLTTPWNDPEHADEWMEDKDQKLWVHKKTGLVATGRAWGQYFSSLPEQCVSSYAAMNLSAYGDDMADSAVAYIAAPGLLKEISPLKYAIFESLDETKKSIEDTKDTITVNARRIPKEEIKLPEVPEEEKIQYYYAA